MQDCHTHFWGNPHFCPSCKTDLWYEEYNDENWDFRALQEEGNRLIAKGNYEKAAVVLKLALDQVMYKHAQHSMHRLKDAVSDFVWLYSNEAADISDDRITDVLDYFEEECFGQPDKYRENLCRCAVMHRGVCHRHSIVKSRDLIFLIYGLIGSLHLCHR